MNLWLTYFFIHIHEQYPRVNAGCDNQGNMFCNLSVWLSHSQVRIKLGGHQISIIRVLRLNIQLINLNTTICICKLTLSCCATLQSSSLMLCLFSSWKLRKSFKSLKSRWETYNLSSVLLICYLKLSWYIYNHIFKKLWRKVPQ